MRNGPWKTTLPMLVLSFALVVAIIFGSWAIISGRQAADRGRNLARQVAVITFQREMDARVRRREVDRFLKQMCVQDAAIVGEIILVLREARERAQAANAPVRVRQYGQAIQNLIDIVGRCVDTLPDLTPP